MSEATKYGQGDNHTECPTCEGKGWRRQMSDGTKLECRTCSGSGCIPSRHLEPKPYAEAVFCPNPDCVYPAGHKSDHSPSAHPKPDAAGERDIALIEACKALCWMCARGMDFEWSKGDPIHWELPDGARTRHVEGRCEAEKIRRLMLLSAPRNSALEEQIADLTARAEQSESLQAKTLAMYEAAVKGRQQFRSAFKLARKHEAIATARAEKAERELYLSRVRMFTRYRSTSCNHTTACTIWGDDGQGGTAEGYAEPLPCNCGALLNYERTRAEAAEAELAAVHKRLDAISEEDRMTRNANSNPSEGGDGYGNC